MILKYFTFEELPNAVSLLAEEIRAVKELLLKQDRSKPLESVEQLLSVEEAAEFLNLAIPTIYSKVSKRELPSMKRGKKLYFSNLELIDYLKKGRKSTNEEILESAGKYVSKRKGGK